MTCQNKHFLFPGTNVYFFIDINIFTRRVEDSDIFSPILKKLNENERAAISLKINEGYSAKEIAEILDCAESTAWVYIFHAKRKLKKLLEEKKDV